MEDRLLGGRLTFENIEWARKNAFMNIDWSCQDRHKEGTDQNSIVQIKIWSALHAILQMTSLNLLSLENIGRGEQNIILYIWHDLFQDELN